MLNIKGPPEESKDPNLSPSLTPQTAMFTPTTSPLATTPTHSTVSATSSGVTISSRQDSQPQLHHPLQGQGSADSNLWERVRRGGSRHRKRGSLHSLHSVGSRRFSSASRSSEAAGELRKNSLLVVSRGMSTAESDEDEVSSRPEWALDQIELSDSGSDEFFDAKGEKRLKFEPPPPLHPPRQNLFGVRRGFTAEPPPLHSSLLSPPHRLPE